MVEVVNIRTCKDIGRPGDVYIGRKNINFSESKWANPFPIGRCIVNDEEEYFNRETCILRYMRYLSNGEVVNVNGKIWRGDLAKQSLHELKNAKRLACWCFGEDTLITTLRGLIPIEKIIIGDMVLSHDSKYHKVTNIMMRENIQTIQVKIMGIPEPIICTPNHEFYACKRLRVQSHYHRKVVTYPPEWIPASNLKKALNASHSMGTVIGFPKDIIIEDDTHSNEFWYIIGRYLGDGWIIDYSSKSSYIKNDGTRNKTQTRGIGICTSHKDGDTLEEKIKNAGFHISRYESKTTSAFRIFSKDLLKFISQFGKYSHGKYIPELCYKLSIDKQKSLLQGILDADGYFDIERQRFHITTVSRLLAYGISRLCRNVTNAQVAICKKSIPRKSSIIDGREIRYNHAPYDISWKLYPINNKSTDNCIWMSFREITTGEIINVYNLTVEGSESYIVNGAAVHNCSPLPCHGDFLKKLIISMQDQTTLNDCGVY